MGFAKQRLLSPSKFVMLSTLIRSSTYIFIIFADQADPIMAMANGVLHKPMFGRFSVEKQESLLKLAILSIAAVLAFSTRLFSVLRSDLL